MPDGWTVYVSSTFKDLVEHRAAVASALRKLSSVHRVIAMEDYVAADQRPLERVLADVGQADIYVGIFAWRYGFVPQENNPEQKSITELEFRHAKANGKACLIFVLKDDAPWNPVFADFRTRENDAGERIDALRRELLDGQLASPFSQVPELAGLVSTAVANHIARHTTTPPVPAPRELQPQFRELRNSFYLAHAALDAALGNAVVPLLASGLEKVPVTSTDALFAEDAPAFEILDQTVTHCHAAIVLLTPGSRDQLQARTAQVAAVLDILRARTGAVAALLAGV